MRKYFNLFLCFFVLYILTAYVGPFVISLFPTWEAFNEELEEHGIEGGALFYTEIPFIYEAEAHVRAGVKKGMEMREAKSESE